MPNVHRFMSPQNHDPGDRLDDVRSLTFTVLATKAFGAKISEWEARGTKPTRKEESDFLFGEMLPNILAQMAKIERVDLNALASEEKTKGMRIIQQAVREAREKYENGQGLEEAMADVSRVIASINDE